MKKLMTFAVALLTILSLLSVNISRAAEEIPVRQIRVLKYVNADIRIKVIKDPENGNICYILQEKRSGKMGYRYYFTVGISCVPPTKADNNLQSNIFNRQIK